MKIVVFTALFAVSLFAHSQGGIGGFSSGMMHPLGGVDHILAMVGVGIVASFATNKVLPLAGFIGAMIVAAVLGYAGVAMFAVEAGILLSIAVIFGLIGYASKIATHFIVLIVAVFGAFHGFAHGAEFAGGSFFAYILGFGLSTLVLHLFGLWLGKLYQNFLVKPQTQKAD
jgi:urease accessory protein